MHSPSRAAAHLPGWAAPLGAAATAASLRTWLLARGSVPFNSDEAVVALMARHILQGQRPVFFYGQAYLGSLDAWLVAGAFRLAGESVVAVRIVQLILYLSFIMIFWRLALDVFANPLPAGVAVWLLAIPAVYVVTYTTASLGGYGELMVLGVLVLWLANRIANGTWHSNWSVWAVLGLCSGVGFWVSGLFVVFALPAAVIILLKLRPIRVGFLSLAGTAFLIGSSPWWVYNLQHGWAALAAFTGEQYGNSTLWMRLTGLLLVGLPALAGIRFPWQAELAPPLLTVWGSLLFIGPLIFLGVEIKRKLRNSGGLNIGTGALLITTLVFVFLVIFLFSRFGVDATGRYLLPLCIPVTLLLAWTIAAATRQHTAWGIALLLSALFFQAVQTGRAALSQDGLTTQFDPITRFDNRHDAELIAFLTERGESRGYSHYWVTFRLAFLSQENLIFAPSLPYKNNLALSPQDNRLPAYTEAANASPQTAYILTSNPALEDRVVKGLSELNVAYQVKVIGPYRVYYRLSQPVRPWQLGIEVTP